MLKSYKKTKDKKLLSLLGQVGNGKYQILKKIAEGGHGKVLKASCVNGEKKKSVVLKIISLDSQRAFDNLQKEINILTKLQSKNVVKLIDHYVVDFENEKMGVLVFNKMKLDLMDFFMTFPLTLKERKQIFCKLCKIVRYCHKRGVYHLDLKPDNFLVNYKFENDHPIITSIKICDFGCAFDVNTIELPQIFGTAEYKAPEAISSAGGLYIDNECEELIPEKLDSWSLGVILYILITGVYPFIVRDGYMHWAGLSIVREFAGNEAYQLLKKIFDYDPEVRFCTKKIMNNSWLRSQEDDLFSNLLTPSLEVVGESNKSLFFTFCRLIRKMVK